MQTWKKINKKNHLLGMFLVLSLLVLGACNGNSASNSNNEEHNMGEHDEDHDMEDMEHEHDEGRIANPAGTAITILSPADESVFAEGDEVIIEVQVDNFELGVEDNHWHVYVNGTSWGMVMGGNTSQALNGIEAGEHHVEVYLAGGDHIEFKDGDSIHITVQ